MKVELYTKSPCGYCVRAKMLLEKHDMPFEEISITEHRDTMFERVIAATGEAPRTAPQIFIDDQYIGGFDQLSEWFKARNEAAN